MSLSFIKTPAPFFSLILAAIGIASIVLGPRLGFAAHQAESASTVQPLIPEHALLNGQEYSKQDLLSTFSEIAFSTYIRPNLFPEAMPSPPYDDCSSTAAHPIDTLVGLKRYSVRSEGILNPDPPALCATPADFHQRYPWLYEYLYRDHGMPRFFAINKWVVPIRISTGYPNDLAPLLGSASGSAQSKAALSRTDPNLGLLISDFSVEAARHRPNAPQYSPPDSKKAAEQTSGIAIEEVKADIPLLAKLTGLPVSYIPHEEETIEHPANLRIVIADNLVEWKNALKRASVLPSGELSTVKMEIGHLKLFTVPTAIEFTPLQSLLVSAVNFTPYSDQQVDGFFLPAADNSIGMSFCFIGNKSDPDILRTLVRECLVRSLGLPGAPRIAPSMILGLWNERTSNLAQWQRWVPETPEITEFDRFMIGLLYNPAIKPGMSILDLYRAAAQATEPPMH